MRLEASQEDREREYDRLHHSDYESGFDTDSTGDSGMSDEFSLDDLFADDTSSSGGGDDFFSSFGSTNSSNGNNFGNSNDPFGTNSNNGFGSSNDPFGSGFGQNNGFGQGNNFGGGFGQSNGFGQNNSFGQGNNFGGGFGQNNGFGGLGQNNGFGQGFGQNNSFGGLGQNPQQQQKQPDMMDKAFETGVDTAKNLGGIFLDMFKSVKERSADDFGYLSRNIIIAGAFSLPIGILLGIIGVSTGVRFLSFAGISLQIALCGALSLAFGITGIGISVLVLLKRGEADAGELNDILDVPGGQDNITDVFEDNIGDSFDDMFGTDLDELFADDNSEIDTDSVVDDDIEISLDDDEDKPNIIIDTPVAVDYDSLLEDISSNDVINRERLFATFKLMFPLCTPEFAVKKKLEETSKEFQSLATYCTKALANIANCSMEEIPDSVKLVEVEENYFSYTLKLRRFNKVKNCDALANEIEIYTRDNSSDESVNATVTLEGDYYKIVLTKGVSAIVSFGDVFKSQEVCDFFLDKNNKMPIITGIDELGNVITEDAKVLDSMMITGKPRSGKSWYVLGIIMMLMLFNTPEEVQFIIVDPKGSNLFKTLSLMPHVCGLHDNKKILSILDDIIILEAKRRTDILANHKCDDIWALRKKGVVLPILYLVLDEYITIKNELSADEQKELTAKIQTLISRLPSLGIRLILVPHRATGIFDKTNRSMLQFTACVRADAEEVQDVTGDKSWKRALVQQGDTAARGGKLKSATYVRGVALTASDEENTRFIETAAKSLYKMGVEVPDMSTMRIACNKTDAKAKAAQLKGQSGTTFVQDSFSNDIDTSTPLNPKSILDSLNSDSIDFSSI